MPNTLKNTCKLFADGTKIFCNTFNSKLQGDIDELALWSEKWQLPFNVKKCKSLHIGKRNPQTNYTMNGHMLEQVNYEKDLGIIIDNEFVSQSTFCNRIVNDWNDLPYHIIEANNINTFKNALDKHWFDKKFDTPFT